MLGLDRVSERPKVVNQDSDRRTQKYRVWDSNEDEKCFFQLTHVLVLGTSKGWVATGRDPPRKGARWVVTGRRKVAGG